MRRAGASVRSAEIGGIQGSIRQGMHGSALDIVPTRHGFRLSQHGVVISEVRTTPGPTHSVFDVLAALVAILNPPGRIGILGFAGGGMVAPLVALGMDSPFDSVDLDRPSYELFQQHCPHWSHRVHWHHADAVTWLGRQRPNFGMLLDDLSIPADGDVFKPAVSWEVLPTLIRRRLRPDGIALFNLLLSRGDTWKQVESRMSEEFANLRFIGFDDFQNRLLVAGKTLPSARAMGVELRSTLRRLRSRQAGRIGVRSPFAER